MFSQSDRLQIQQKGLTVDIVNKQIAFFKQGIPVLNISGPAVPNDGILVLSDTEKTKYISVFEKESGTLQLTKFVPASGAATRMFKALYEYISKPASAIIPDDVAQVINKIEAFAFHADLHTALGKHGKDLRTLLHKSEYQEVVHYILGDKGLNYGNLPKGLLKFHSYSDGGRTPFEEHLVEGAQYAKNAKGSVTVHFTVSPEHLQAFSILAESVKSKYEKLHGVTFNISFSVQKPSTDTIAVDGKNNPFRNSDGSLVFRPGGHGALLDNLNDLDGDLIFLKNIDNVVPDRLKETTITYKKVLAGLLLDVQKTIFGYINALDNNQIKDIFLPEIISISEKYLGYKFSKAFFASPEPQQIKHLVDILNRPIRVCGMVRNTGEPGGGPFWVADSEGALTLQILESSQFNLEMEEHRQAFKKATHFNPVDLVVSTKDYKGRKFDLKKYSDPNTGFISLKSKDGKELKALELPGLWNGAMAKWNTIFVEVPISTFNPVKSINDLLRAEHQI
jgi:hypothetical protein